MAGEKIRLSGVKAGFYARDSVAFVEDGLRIEKEDGIVEVVRVEKYLWKS